MDALAMPWSTRARGIGIAFILVSLDFVLISGDLLRHGGLLHDVRFAVTAERGFGEWSQYAKAAAVVLLLLSARDKSPAAVVWAGLFGYMLLDDAFALHEAFGRSAASLVSLPTVGSVRPEHMGELLFYVAMGLVFAGVLAAALRNGDTAGRSLSVALALPFAVLVFFGVVVDVLHSLVRDRSYRYAAGIIEDGGEMLAMSALVTVAYWVTRRE